MKKERARRGKKTPDRPGGVTRRSFFQSVGVAGATVGLAQAEAKPTEPVQEEGQGPGAVPVTLRVNGKTLKMKVEPRVTLLDALRDHVRIDTGDPADLTGSKRVCDRASCGACTMIVDGRTIYGCTMLAVEAHQKSIRTVEGLERNGRLHPLQEEFIKRDGLMCGFCTPGFVVSGVACLERNPRASRDEIRRCLDGNICRCGTQSRVLEAVEAAQRRTKGRR